ncbi:MAG: HAMP domain-containing protein [Rubrobacteraceae bacterium]
MKESLQTRLRMQLRGLGARLFASHMLVTLVGTATFLIAVSISAPAIFGSLMGGMMGPGHLMTMEEMVGSVTRAFMQTLLYSLLAAALAAGVTATLASLFVARRISGPLRRLAGATRRIASGRYEERVPATSDDEIGDLASSFNALAKTLQDTEQRRLDLISDVSHELRTPLSTIEGYMEGLLDGVIEPTNETWALVHGEAERLKRLVEDLQELSRAEAGRLTLEPERLDPATVVRLTAGRLEPLYAEKGVSLKIAVSGDLPPVLADLHVLVEPHRGRATFDFVADNPGDWLFHCHLAYHLETGMARVVSYEGS